ncbi:hypothetical protein PtA15_3A848 [Puccinia triticina]|uniref:Pep3/Vps18/deep orange domain-containing protein n=1 Tax=Puccinia triticina TaxID=208348 RepID=A0ABY7CHN8_9BASI|nr:uncharacterized protein PtA15_3A848 [Puccinia triticina]WAQ83477.1 hypothetical protein PtA15_3A848 [Puccinia triticina]WAR54315.1 hypothetical protein PtB15_3B829 [Puccinia triticina]
MHSPGYEQPQQHTLSQLDSLRSQHKPLEEKPARDIRPWTSAVSSPASQQQTNYYLPLTPAALSQHRSQQQPLSRRTPPLKPLPKLKGLRISAIILATPTGALFSTLLVDPHSQEPSPSDLSITAAFSRIDRPTIDRHLKPLYTLPTNPAGAADDTLITAVHWDIWYHQQSPQQNTRITKRALALVSTATRLYQFVDQVGILKSKRDEDPNDQVLQRLFGSYQSNRVLPKSIELQAAQNSQLYVFNPSSNSPPILSWLTGAGIYCGEIVHGTQEPGDPVIGPSELIPFPSPNQPIAASSPPPDPPLAFCPTEYHFVLLFPDRIQIVCRLDRQIVHEEILDLKPDESIRSITTDPVDQTYWLYSEQSIFELVVKNEGRDIWKVYLARKDFEKALSHVDMAIDRDKILVSQADHYLQTGKHISAAQIYAQCSKPFEEVVLGFIDRGERDALRYYLISRLERLKRQDLTQRMMLATWLTEIYLAKINELEDLVGADPSAADQTANIVVEQQLIEDELQQFLRTYKADLDQRTTFDLITSHGRKDVMIYYANLVGDHQRIIRHHILEEDWKKAIDGLNRQADLELYYKFAPVLVSHDARAATTAFMRQPKLDVKRLIPALIPPRRSAKKGTEENEERVIEYLKFVISRLNNSDAPVHNALLTLYATQRQADEGSLLRFLASTPDNPVTGKPYYDLDYALRICKVNNKLQACGLIYSKMGLYESSVDLALRTGDLELAKINAEKAEDDRLLRKKLWLKIAAYVVEDQKDIKTAMAFLEATDLLQIEDILPFFPDFVVIDEFKDPICNALESYSARIARLKMDMEESHQTTLLIQNDLALLSQRFLVINQADTCCSCAQALLSCQFYLFPCQHSFHAACLIKETMAQMPPYQLRRLLTLQTKLGQLDPTGSVASQQPAGRSLLPAGILSDSKKLALASVQGLDHVRKLIIPDALVGLIGGGVGKVGSGVEALGGVWPAIPRLVRSSSSILPKHDHLGHSPTAASSSTPRFVGPRSHPQSLGTSTATGTGATEIQKLKNELDSLVASCCPLCAGAINAIDRPFVQEGELEI